MIRSFFRQSFVTVAVCSFFLADPAYPGWNKEKITQLYDVTPAAVSLTVAKNNL